MILLKLHFQNTFTFFTVAIASHGPSLALFVPTKKGRLLVYQGYTYWLKNRLLYGKKQWYCSSRHKTGCMAAINTQLQRIGDVVKVIRGVHNHEHPVAEMYFLPSANYGSSVLIYKNYKFWINNRLKNSLSWACSYRKRLGCQCRVVTTRNGNFISVHSEHNHPPRWYGRPEPKNLSPLTFNLEFDEYMKAYNNYI